MRQLTKEDCLKIAFQCSHKKDLERKDGYVYKKMLKNGWINEVFTEIYKRPDKYSYEDLKKIALKYPSKNAFKWGDYNAYHRARTKSYFEEICSHMNTISGTDADVLYLLKITDNEIYKVGITSDRCKKRRISELNCHSGFKFDIIKWIKTDNALKLEKELLIFGEIPDMTQFSGYKECRIFTKEELKAVVDLIDQAGGVLS